MIIKERYTSLYKDRTALILVLWNIAANSAGRRTVKKKNNKKQGQELPEIIKKQNDKKMRQRIINRSYDFVISEKSVIFAHRLQMCNIVCTK